VFLRSPPGNQVTFQNGGQLPQCRWLCEGSLLE